MERTITLPANFKVRQVFANYLITQNEINGTYEAYSLITKELLRGKYNSTSFDSIEVIGNKIHTTFVLKNKLYLEQWFDKKGELLLYIEKEESEDFYRVYDAEVNSLISTEVQKINPVLDENGNIRGVVITRCKQNCSNTGIPIMYYNFKN